MVARPRRRAGSVGCVVSKAVGLAQRVGDALGYTFKNTDIVRHALMHASVADTRLESNERLEFLGDAVLGMLVCEYLFRTFPDLLEGDLTKIKSAIVSRRLCAKLTRELGLDRELITGKGMQGREDLPSSLSAAVLESIIGAVYLDGGFEAVQDVFLPLLEPHVRRAADSGHQQNFKSVLQQFGQREYAASPQYLLLDEQGPDHAKAFRMCVELDGRRFEACWAASKKQAEQQSARLALEELGLLERDDSGNLIYTGEDQTTPPAPLNGNAPSAPEHIERDGHEIEIFEPA